MLKIPSTAYVRSNFIGAYPKKKDRKTPLQLVHLRTDFAELNDTAALESENALVLIGILFHVGNEASMELQVIDQK